MFVSVGRSVGAARKVLVLPIQARILPTPVRRQERVSYFENIAFSEEEVPTSYPLTRCNIEISCGQKPIEISEASSNQTNILVNLV